MCTSCDTAATEQDPYAIPENRLPRLRPTFEEVYMGLAHHIRLRSSCYRMAVGAVAVSTDFRTVYANGYNGNATGLDDGCDSEEVGNCGCLHAEENLAIQCNVAREVPKYVFVTHLPCKMCAKRLLNLGGVKRVYYAFDYRIRESLEIFKKVGVEACHLPASADRDELALFKAAEDMYQSAIVDMKLEESMIGIGKPFATPYAYQMHMVCRWRDAVTSQAIGKLQEQANAEDAPKFIKDLSKKIQWRLKVEQDIQQDLEKAKQ